MDSVILGTYVGASRQDPKDLLPEGKGGEPPVRDSDCNRQHVTTTGALAGNSWAQPFPESPTRKMSRETTDIIISIMCFSDPSYPTFAACLTCSIYMKEEERSTHSLQRHRRCFLRTKRLLSGRLRCGNTEMLSRGLLCGRASIYKHSSNQPGWGVRPKLTPCETHLGQALFPIKGKPFFLVVQPLNLNKKN